MCSPVGNYEPCESFSLYQEMQRQYKRIIHETAGSTGEKMDAASRRRRCQINHQWVRRRYQGMGWMVVSKRMIVGEYVSRGGMDGDIKCE